MDIFKQESLFKKYSIREMGDSYIFSFFPQTLEKCFFYKDKNFNYNDIYFNLMSIFESYGLELKDYNNKYTDFIHMQIGDIKGLRKVFFINLFPFREDYLNSNRCIVYFNEEKDIYNFVEDFLKFECYYVKRFLITEKKRSYYSKIE
jgi:hypothetical protein